MTGKSRDAPKRVGKSKQTEPAETIPRDVGEFVGTVAHEVRSIARLVRGLLEADASQESAALIKRRTGVSDEGVDDASKSLLDRPLGEILEKKNVHVAEDEAVLSVGNLATVIESRLNILHEFARAVQKRNILGTPQGLQFLDKHRPAHYPRIVPLVEPTPGYRQLAEENEQLKRDNALIQKEADEFAHDLGQREADAELNSVSSSRQSRRHVLGIHIWIAIPLALFVALVLTVAITWSSAVHYYGVAEYAERERQAAVAHREELKMRDARHLEMIAESMREGRYREAMLYIDAMLSDHPTDEMVSAHVNTISALHREIWGDDADLSELESVIAKLESRHHAIVSRDRD